jgi:hypothetical protein
MSRKIIESNLLPTLSELLPLNIDENANNIDPLMINYL